MTSYKYLWGGGGAFVTLTEIKEGLLSCAALTGGLCRGGLCQGAYVRSPSSNRAVF